MRIHKIKNLHKLDEKYIVFKYLWLMIAFPKPVQLAILLMITILLLKRTRFQVKLDNIGKLILLLASVHAFAIFYDLAVIADDFNRLPAAINTLALWPLSAIYYSYYKKYGDEIDTVKLGKYCWFNVLVNGILGILSAYLYYLRHIPGVIILGKNLYGTTYLEGDPTTKFIGLNDFSNINLFYIMIMFCLSIPYLYTKKKSFRIFTVLLASFSVFMIHSRAGMVLYTFSLCMYLYEIIPSKRYRRVIMLFMIMFIGLILSLDFNTLFTKFSNRIIYGNVSSTTYRVSLQMDTIRLTLQQSPIWGLGIKRVYRPGEAFVAYFGSHSSYVGFFYKTGFIGLIIGLSIVFLLNKNALRYRKYSAFIRWVFWFFICFVVLFGIEDIDGTNWSIIIYFSTLAILYRIGKRDYEQRKFTEGYCNIPSTVS